MDFKLNDCGLLSRYYHALLRVHNCIVDIVSKKL